MAKGDKTGNPNLHLTPVPHVDGGTVNRLTKVHTDADSISLVDPDAPLDGTSPVIDETRAATAAITDIIALTALVIPDANPSVFLGALDNPIADWVVIDRAARNSRNDSVDVRRAAVLHPLVKDHTVFRVRDEAENGIETLTELARPHGFASERVKASWRAQAAASRDLITVVDQVLTSRGLEDGI